MLPAALVTSGLVLAAITVSFMMAIHSNTGSGVAAAANDAGQIAQSRAKTTNRLGFARQTTYFRSPTAARKEKKK